jgi:hypothetical protein
MNKFFALIIMFCCTATVAFGQKLIRSSMNSFGNTVNENGTTFRQTIGQSSSTSVFSNSGNSLRQGFQQPLSKTTKGNRLKEKECTMYLNPNPSSDVVYIRFAEDVAENEVSVVDMVGRIHIKTTLYTSEYALDISKLSKGIYMINVTSKSGYRCREKLIVN